MESIKVGDIVTGVGHISGEVRTGVVIGWDTGMGLPKIQYTLRGKTMYAYCKGVRKLTKLEIVLA